MQLEIAEEKMGRKPLKRGPKPKNEKAMTAAKRMELKRHRALNLMHEYKFEELTKADCLYLMGKNFDEIEGKKMSGVLNRFADIAKSFYSNKRNSNKQQSVTTTKI